MYKVVGGRVVNDPSRKRGDAIRGGRGGGNVNRPNVAGAGESGAVRLARDGTTHFQNGLR